MAKKCLSFDAVYRQKAGANRSFHVSSSLAHHHHPSVSMGTVLLCLPSPQPSPCNLSISLPPSVSLSPQCFSHPPRCQCLSKATIYITPFTSSPAFFSSNFFSFFHSATPAKTRGRASGGCGVGWGRGGVLCVCGVLIQIWPN